MDAQLQLASGARPRTLPLPTLFVIRRLIVILTCRNGISRACDPECAFTVRPKRCEATLVIVRQDQLRIRGDVLETEKTDLVIIYGIGLLAHTLLLAFTPTITRSPGFSTVGTVTTSEITNVLLFTVPTVMPLVYETESSVNKTYLSALSGKPSLTMVVMKLVVAPLAGKATWIIAPKGRAVVIRWMCCRTGGIQNIGRARAVRGSGKVQGERSAHNILENRTVGGRGCKFQIGNSRSTGHRVAAEVSYIIQW